MNWEVKRRRRKDVTDRAAFKDLMYERCRIIGCRGTTTAAAGKGLDRLYCRRHADHFERHGSYLNPSYTAKQLAPYRKSAASWLRTQIEDRAVQLAIHAVQRHYIGAG